MWTGMRSLEDERVFCACIMKKKKSSNNWRELCTGIAKIDDDDNNKIRLPKSLYPFHVRVWRLWTSGSVGRNKELVDRLQQYGIIKSKRVKEVMEAIDRACLELLADHLQPGMKALDVGSGTGYLTACFAMMVGPEGLAVGVEHIPELVEFSTNNIRNSAAASFLNEGSLSLNVGDGRLGWPEQAPYDAIHVGAAAHEIPQMLIDQLKPGGRLVIPVGSVFQDLQVVDKNMDGSVNIRTEASVRYVPLTSKAAQLHNH
ncbi:protein-L-isoaspartate O-methyltransferase-like isoform X3 [Zingiber officinale]|uniref:protein-L-isoaspartate O-methyltransferase-like isoform X3 n=1 Tax=Zingiber officinale TaxID=94328 RepID=UPI001C4D5921|nr:protein-L-isoaspartate O-methyltransferase-like isoform X3 [Zingiber officinale]